MKKEKEEKEEELRGENLLRDIYGQLLLPQQSVYLEQAEQKLEEAVNEVLAEYRDSLSSSEYEAWREKFYKVAFCAQENGFLAGFRYSVDLLGGKTEQEITVSLLNRLVDDKMKKWNSWHCQKKGQKDV